MQGFVNLTLGTGTACPVRTNQRGKFVNAASGFVFTSNYVTVQTPVLLSDYITPFANSLQITLSMWIVQGPTSLTQ